MGSDNWKEVKEILADALDLPESERRSYIDGLGLPPETRAEVDSFLAFETESEDVLRLSAVEFSKDFFADSADEKLVGQQIGNYRITREIGYGGMGVVYLAERSDGKFEQKVALKLLKRELNTAALRRRFEHEREILASLEHPNIARLLDAGTTDDQVPFIAMEYVDGLPIDVYCDKHGLGLAKRLDLFRTVCSTVNFAHRNLVVHRDLKPSNILVNSDGVPKLLDFGIAKVLSEELSAFGASTVTNLGVMTPSYASPEQLRNESVTTATDIYSLGVILYELLTGSRPFREQEADLQEIFKAVLEAEPRPPSDQVVTAARVYQSLSDAGTEVLAASPKAKEQPTLAARPNTDAGRQKITLPGKPSINATSLRGDLDNIVLKALRKEPERRYTSAENLAEDIHRHQRGLPVTARPNTFSYRIERFYVRNKAGAIGAGLVILAVLAGVVATVWQARVAQAERAKAEKRFNDVRTLANSYLFDVYPEIENLEGSLKAREKIITNALQYLDSLSSEATDDLSLQSELATAYEKVGDVQGALSNSSLGNVQAGLDSYAKAAKLREAVYAANPSDLEAKEKLANNYYTTARTLWNSSRTAEAEQAFERALGLRRELVRDLPESADHQNRLAVLLIDYGAIPVFNSQTEKAVVLFDEAFAIIEKLRASDPENGDFKKAQTRLLRIMSKAKGSLGDYEAAVRGFDLAITISDDLAKQFPNDFRVQRSVWLTHLMKCELFIGKQDGKQAVDTCSPTTAFPENALAKEPENGVVAYDLAISYFNVARANRIAENFTVTVENTAKASAVMARLSEKNPENNEYKRNLAIYETERARALVALRKYSEALAPLAGVIRIMEPIAEADKESLTYQYDLSIAHRLLARAQFETSQREKAISSIEKAIEIAQQLKDKDAVRESDKNLMDELLGERAEFSGK